MTGFTALLRKELLEIVSTWRVWVVGGLLLGMAVLSALTGRYQKELIGSLLAAGIQITLPDPTWADSFAQWAKNLTEIGLLMVVLTTGGLISAERSQGSLVLVLTKPVSRTAYVVAKFLAQAGFLAVATALAAGAELALTAALFPAVEAGPVIAVTGAWLVLAMLLMACTLVGSAGLDRGLAAAGTGLAGLVVLLVLGLWEPATRYSPAGLYQAVGALAAGGQVSAWPVVTGLVATAVLVAAAAGVMSRREV